MLKADVQCVLYRPRQGLLEKQGQAELVLHQMASSYTPVCPIVCHLFISPFTREARLSQIPPAVYICIYLCISHWSELGHLAAPKCQEGWESEYLVFPALIVKRQRGLGMSFGSASPWSTTMTWVSKLASFWFPHL